MLRKIRGKTKQLTARQIVPIIIGLIPTVVFLVFIYFMMICTFSGTVKETVKDTNLSFTGLETLSDSFEDVLEDNFYDKDEYINLNGWTTRALGIHTLNERQLLTNGQLDFSSSVLSSSIYDEKKAGAVIELNDFLDDREINFIYLLAPTKRAFYTSALAPGYSSTNTKEDFDTMIETLDDAGVLTINFNDWYEENGRTMDEVYYKTDRHWNTQTSLEAVRTTMEFLSDRGLASYDSALLDEDSWTTTVYKNWYLGDHGKRTGMAYAGLDDIVLYQPNFKVDYSYAYIRKGETAWNYDDTILDLSYLEDTNIDYFNEDPYFMYMKGDFPNRITVNSEAINDQRVLLVGDSFKVPFEYFLSTEFQEIYTIDLRYCTDGATLAEYIQEFQPDIVIMCTNNIDEDDLYTFGVAEYLAALNKTNPQNEIEATELGNFAVETNEDGKNIFNIICYNLEPGTYTLTVDSTEYSGGYGQHIQMTLQDISSDEAIANRYFDGNSDDTQKWIFTVPDSADTYAVYLYGGTKGNTINGSVKIKNVTLYKGIYEN